MLLHKQQIANFQNKIWQYYYNCGRDLPWRHINNPYYILVSEMMLQQTQVSRVSVKYLQFIDTFPTIKKLADASFGDVLKLWLGLGYNRRAKYLKQISDIVCQSYGSTIPDNPNILDTLPGIGYNTAAAIVVYSHNKPHVFIETNIRKIYIDEFFTNQQNVDDTSILPFVEITLNKLNPIEWYWALMDYGAYLAKLKPNPNREVNIILNNLNLKALIGKVED